MSLASKYVEAVRLAQYLRPSAWQAAGEAARASVTDDGRLVLTVQNGSISAEAALSLAEYIQEVLG